VAAFASLIAASLWTTVAHADISGKANALVAAIADCIFIAHAGKGSKTEDLCKDELAQGKQVFTLDSPDNAHLVKLGAVPVQADNPRPLLTEAVGHADSQA